MLLRIPLYQMSVVKNPYCVSLLEVDMLDVRFVVEHTDKIIENLRKRHTDFNLTHLLNLFSLHKNTLHKLEMLKTDRNRLASEIGRLKIQKQDTTILQEHARELGNDIKSFEIDCKDLADRLHSQVLLLPNLLQDTVPDGVDANDNVLVRTWNTPTAFTFTPKAHNEIGEGLGIIDFQRAAKISGSRFAVLRGAGAALERALINLFLDTHIRHGYQEVMVPYLVNTATMTGTGQLPKFEEDLFKIQGSDLYLIPTAEVPVTNLHAGEILAEDGLPLRYCAFTPCFRAEAGSHGRDVKGLIRQHQFHKVELVQFAHPDQSRNIHEELVRYVECLLELLQLPYRTMHLCAGDTGNGSSRTYDIEVWMPGQNQYREISSCSNFLDYQARRANIRFRPKVGGKPRYVHTLNASGLAIGRTMVAILENYQQEDGSVIVPEVLRPYMHMDVIK